MPIKDSKIFSGKDLFERPKQQQAKPHIDDYKVKKDWLTLTQEMKAQADEQQRVYNDLVGNLQKKQDRYIMREQEYRHTIENIGKEIKGRSTNPFNLDGSL